jgi:hypothetical protein
MAENDLRIVGALIEGLIDGVIESTGPKGPFLSAIEISSFVEIPMGILFWAAAPVVSGALIFIFAR